MSTPVTTTSPDLARYRHYLAALLDQRRAYASHLAALRTAHGCEGVEDCPADDEHYDHASEAHPVPSPPRPWMSAITEYADYDDAELDALLVALVAAMGEPPARTCTDPTRDVLSEAVGVAERMGGAHAARAEFLAAIEAANRSDRAGTDAGVRQMQGRAAYALRCAVNPHQRPAGHLSSASVYADAALVLWRVYVRTCRGREVTVAGPAPEVC